jgi:hypothetical protein
MKVGSVIADQRAENGKGIGAGICHVASVAGGADLSGAEGGGALSVGLAAKALGLANDCQQFARIMGRISRYAAILGQWHSIPMSRAASGLQYLPISKS